MANLEKKAVFSPRCGDETATCLTEPSLSPTRQVVFRHACLSVQVAYRVSRDPLKKERPITLSLQMDSAKGESGKKAAFSPRCGDEAATCLTEPSLSPARQVVFRHACLSVQVAYRVSRDTPEKRTAHNAISSNGSHQGEIWRKRLSFHRAVEMKQPHA